MKSRKRQNFVLIVAAVMATASAFALTGLWSDATPQTPLAASPAPESGPAPAIETIVHEPADDPAPDAAPVAGTGAPPAWAAARVAVSAVTARHADAEAAEPISTPPAPAVPAATATWQFDRVVEQARQLAQSPFDASSIEVSDAAHDLDYDDYRRIEFKAESAVSFAPDNDRFRVMFDPAGFIFGNRVEMNLVVAGQAQARPYSADDFRFFDLSIDDATRQSLGIAGFRVLTPLNAEGKFDELVSFRGASFFRALGMDSRYGVSARGLALGTASPEGEEFPLFREFWILAPEAGATTIEVAALLDSPSLSGAYRFSIAPGQSTVMQVEAVLFPRVTVEGAGIAPLTSMFHFAPHDPDAGREDLRPRVHDSEGLMAWMANGEYVWRPLLNPQRLEVSSFATQRPNGFGLVQRERRFDEYDDLEAAYDQRPNLWVVPGDDWPDGELVLIEIPTENEFNDNIVLFWRSQAPWPAGQPVTLAYTLAWGNQSPLVLPVASVGQTRVGRSVNSGKVSFMIDFEAAQSVLPAGMTAEVSSTDGNVLHPVVVVDDRLGGARLSFELDDGEVEDGTELRARLVHAGRTMSETWLYRWRPQA